MRRNLWRLESVADIAGCQGGNTTHAPAGFACGLTALQGGVSHLRLESAWRVREFYFMTTFAMLKVLVVTLRSVWFNFRGWKKRP
jgi:hypothetical protein